MLEVIDLGGHLHGHHALRAPKSAGTLVDTAGYIRAEVSHVAPVQARCSVSLYPLAALSAELTKRLAGGRELLLSPDTNEKSCYLFLLLHLKAKHVCVTVCV